FEAVETPRRHVAGRISRARLPAGGARELSGADRLVARRKRGAAAAQRAREAIPDRGCRQERRRLRSREARVGEPALPQTGGAGTARGSRLAVSGAAWMDRPGFGIRDSGFGG